VETSALIEHRAKVVVPQRMRDIEVAIASRNFEDFAKITIQDSNQFHAICLDT
jgi:diphosphomevalonate decarboxylase